MKNIKILLFLATLLCSVTATSQVVAKDDILYIGKGVVFTIDVLANDTGSDRPFVLTQPTKASATTIVGSNKIMVTPHGKFDGHDSFTYQICDDKGNCATATVQLVKVPDNFIEDSKCATAPPMANWSFSQKWVQNLGAGTTEYMSPSAGDLDGDGIAEIVTFVSSNIYDFKPAKVEVRRGTDGLLLASYNCSYSNNGQNMPTLVDLNKDGKGEVVVFNANRQLVALTFTRTSATTGTLTPLFTSTTAVTLDVADSYNVDVCDFGSDGRTEVLVGPYVFNDQLKLIAQAPFTIDGTGFISQCPSRRAIAADINGDGKLDIVAGKNTYKVNITDPNNFVAGAITLLASSGRADGFPAVADIDGDGDLDVVVVGPTATYAWDGATSAYIAGETHTTEYWVSPPLIADVDGDGVLEVIYNRSKATQCLRYNGTTTFAKPWVIASQDPGGGTWITAFDFDNDGAAELVYREDGGLRIIDGKTRQLKQSYPVTSGTLTDGPIIADVNGDGQAEIIVTGRSSGATLHCFASTGDPWSYARPVWNQYMYNGVNINDDLTVPQYQINGAGFKLANKTPLNNYMQQHTLLSLSGGIPISVSSLSDIVIQEAEIVSQTSTALTVKFTVTNLENGIATANIPIALFVTNGANKTYVNTQNITSNVAPAQKVTQTLTFNITGQANQNYLFLINANSAVFPNNALQKECDYDNNYFTLKKLEANNDKVINTVGSIVIDVLANDSLLTCSLSSIDLKIITPPTKGTATLTYDKKINYSSTSKDSLQYQIKCDSKTSTAWVYIDYKLPELPDNIVDPKSDCVDEFGDITFKIKQKWSSATNTAYNMAGTLVGDIVGDGRPVVVTYNGPFPNNGNGSLNVLDGVTGKTLWSQTIPITIVTGGWAPIINAVLVDSDADGKGEIIFAGTDRKVVSYEVSGVEYDDKGNKTKLHFNKKWGDATVVQYTNPSTIDNYPHISVCDFNGDGKAELIIYNEIFDAVTGKRIGAYGEGAGISKQDIYVGRVPNFGGNKNSNLQALADLDDDGFPEIIAGGKVYKITIDQLGNATSTLLHHCTAVGDGYTAIADLDMDGNLEVVVTNVINTKVYMHIWRPVKGTVNSTTSLQKIEIDPIALSHHSFPFIGDIDGVEDASNGNKKYPEICINVRMVPASPAISYGMVRAYKYNSTTKKFVWKWDLKTTDASGGTTLTLFNFDNDKKGINELVYRDQTDIKIYNGEKDGVPPVIADKGAAIFKCSSGTAYEYPVIADIDGDGNADICVSCGTGIADGKTNNIRAYESANTPWAPTRRVWNQVNYEPTLINKDLTVTKKPLAKHTQFSVNGKIEAPYNGSLIQVATVDMNLKPVVYAPDPYVDKIQATWVDKETGIIQLSVVVGNNGSIMTNGALPITLYKGNASGEIIGTKTIGVGLAPGSTVTIDFVQINIADLAAGYTARIQDDGLGVQFPVSGFYDCEKGNNTLSTNNLFLNNDYMVAFSETETELKVTQNDVISSACNPELTVISAPLNGTYLRSGLVLKYTSNNDYFGDDELTYQIKCDDNTTATATVKIKVVPKADNMSDAECFTKAPKEDWSFSELMRSPASVNINFFSTPMVGDLDGDGKSEIVVAQKPNKSGVLGNVLFVFEVVNNQMLLKHTINTPYMTLVSDPYALANVDKNGHAAIFVLTSHHSNPAADQRQLIKYQYDSGINNYKEAWRKSYTSNMSYTGARPMIVDFNHDGFAEVSVLDKVFDAQNGTLLADGGFITGAQGFVTQGFGFGGHVAQSTIWDASMPMVPTSQMAIADIDNDYTPEVIGGNTVYKVDIKSRTDISKNSFTLYKQVTSTIAHPEVKDGAVAVADMDLDGFMDIAVTTIGSTLTNSALYIWNPRTGKIMNDNVVANFPKTNHELNGISAPFIGNIDGDTQKDGFPEICLTAKEKIYAYKYNAVSKQLTKLWEKSTTDASGATTMSMFDFEQDGGAELVYRDQDNLRIINSLGNNKKSVACTSSTGNEFPIVADVNGDGQAEIIVTGGNSVIVFASEGNKRWAPARKVWNQFGYNAVNINDDLTVPRYQLNPSTIFPGEDGQLGTVDDVRPYNGYLMQQTSLNKEGTPLYLTPNAVIINPENIKFDYDIAADELKITGLTIKNKGDALLKSKINISVYKNASLVGKAPKSVFSWNKEIGKNNQATITDADNFVISNFHEFLPTNSLVIRINDNGTGVNDQIVCDSCDVSNGSGDFTIPFDAIGAANKYRHCASASSSVILTGADQSILKGNPVYHWTRPDGVTEPKTGKTVTYNLPSLDKAGQYVLTAKNIGVNANLSVTYKLPYLSVAPTVMYWKSNAGNKNWNDLTNWLDESKTAIKAVPAECTTVHIPAVATNYPSFQENTTTVTTATDYKLYGQPEVDAIVYHFGAETAYPHRLKYNKAYVQYNFGHYNVMPATGINQQTNDNSEGTGASKLNRNQWYALATPIKDMASGDFSFGGYPFTWQAAQNLVTGTSGRLTSLNFDNNNAKNNVRLSDHHNVIGIKVAPFSQGMAGYSDHRHLQSLKGVLEIPYMDNESQKGLHPAHSYDPISKTSSFFYFDNATLQQLASPVDTMKRGEGVFKFVFDGAIKNMTVNGVPNIPCYLMEVTPSDRNYALIGNPFMAIINMENFKKANAAVLKATNNKYQAYVNGVWTPYDYTANNGINSLQAFAIELKDNNKATLTFPLEGDWALTGTATNKIPRRLEILGAIAVTAGYENGAQAGCYAELVSDQMTGAVRKLISQEAHVIPEVFFIDQTGNDFNLIHVYEQGISEVGLGVKCSDTKNELVLSFDHIGEFAQINNTRPVLVDKLLGVEQDLIENSSYRFRQLNTANVQSQYADMKRFAIRFNEGFSANNVDNLQVIYTNGHLEVKTTVKAVEVGVYSLNGQLLFNSGTISATNYHRDLPLAQGGYIVKVKTENNKSTSKKIMAR